MNKLDDYVRAQRIPWGPIGVLAGMALGMIGYGTWWLLQRSSNARLEDLTPAGIGLAVAVLAAWMFVTNRRAVDEMRRFLERPADEVAWIYLEAESDTRKLVLAAADGATTAIKIAGSFSRVSYADLQAVLQEAAERYPRATVGFRRTHAAQFAEDPRTLLRA